MGDRFTPPKGPSPRPQSRSSGFSEVGSVERLINILQQPAKSRNHKEIDCVLVLLQSNWFFREKAKELSNEFSKLCARTLTHEFVPRGETVYCKGDSGTKLYIVIRGCLQSSGDSTDCACLSPYDTFGDTVLACSVPRSETVVASEDSDLAVLHKTEFLDIVDKLDQKRLSDLVGFLHSIPAFARMSRGTIHRLSGYFRPRHYTRKQCVYRSGEPAEEVFIVKEGELALVQEISARKVGSQMEAMGSYRGGKVVHHQANLALVGVGEFVGDMDVVERRRRTQTCVCSSSLAVVLCISKGDYLRMFESEEVWSDLKERLKAKTKLREERIRSIEFRLQSQTPTEVAEFSPAQSVPRSKSFSKTSRFAEGNPLLQTIKSRILAHEPTILNTESPSPKKKPPDLTVCRQFLRQETVQVTDRTAASLTPPRQVIDKNASFVTFERRAGFRPNAFLQSELIRAGLIRVNGDSPRSVHPSDSPTQKSRSLLEDASKSYRSEWEMRRRKEHLKQVLRNMKRLEVSKRNLWKNKPV